jgi:hypothetical protein
MATTALKTAKRRTVEAPKPGLSRLDDITATEAPDKALSTEIQAIRLEGTTVEEYNRAVAAKKIAEETITKLRPTLEQEGIGAVLNFNCAPECLTQVTSVKIQDVKEVLDPKDQTKTRKIKVNGEVIRLSFTSRYNTCDTEQVDAAFDTFQGRDINTYVVETLVASFDSGVFLDEKGNFDREVFSKYRDAIAKVTAELAPKNQQLQNPDGSPKTVLTTKKVLKVKDDFHKRRFKDFSLEENATLVRVLPNTVQLVPQRTK